MIERLKKWWAGEFRDTPLDVILSGDRFENIVRPSPVRATNAIWRFYLQHWKFVWTSAIAIAGIVVAAWITYNYH